MVSLHITASRAARVLSLVVAALVIASSFGQFSTYYLGHTHLFGFVNLFSLDREANIPSWYSSITLLISGFLLALISSVEKGAGSRWWKHWRGLSVIFLLLSIDELASVHELSIEPVRGLLGAGGIFYWAWVIPGMLFVLVLGVVYFRFLLELPRRTRTYLVAAAVLFVGGALGVEMLGAAWFEVHGRRNIGYSLFWTVEEALEMFGVVVFIYGLLQHLESKTPGVVLRFNEPDAPSARPTSRMNTVTADPVHG